MGLDLTVMASYFRERRGEILPTATLRFDRDDHLFSQLAVHATPCLVLPLSDGLTVGNYEDTGLRFIDTDRYGNRLTFTTPAELQHLVVPDTAPWNRAVITFLLALPPDTIIILLWC